MKTLSVKTQLDIINNSVETIYNLVDATVAFIPNKKTEIKDNRLSVLINKRLISETQIVRVVLMWQEKGINCKLFSETIYSIFYNIIVLFD